MDNVVLNQTPVRTSKNFVINNIKLEKIDFPENLEEFKNVTITTNKSTIEIAKPEIDLVYGLGNISSENVLKSANHSIKISPAEKDDIKISYDFDNDNLSLVNYIQIDASVDCNIIIEYNSKTSKQCFHNEIIKLNVSDGAKVNVILINLLNNKSMNLQSIQNNIGDKSSVNYTVVDIGGRTSISNYYSNIYGDFGSNEIKTIYLGTENQVKDINYIAELYGPNTDINIDVQGALRNNSKKNFKGTIDFKKGCKKAVGNENEYCMLLSDNSKSIALPMLLCSEDDVEGNHSTASGKVDNQELFYIMTRGFEYNEALKLMVKARFNEIIDRITDEELKNRVLEEIDRRLD